MENKEQSGISKQLLSRLTHHVRNPFNGIIGFTDLLNTHFDGLSDDDKSNYIKIVHQLSKKALLRSENLSWWLKHYTGNLTPVLQNVDVADLVREELSYFNSEFQRQHLDLLEDFQSSALVQTDKVMLQSIVKNILMNIVEFTPEGEEVNVKTERKGNELEVIFNNKFKETPSDETLSYILRMETSEVHFANMPENPGLWTIHTLCNDLGIGLTVTMTNDITEVKLRFAIGG